MEEEDTKQCPNCKREIPAVNFTTHSVHCARNLRNCPVCKEPVPVAQLQEHHDALHKEVPCKKCGESVCGTDLEDHIRDSCAQTIKPCRYCELELPRRALPAHEAYCGARSEQCPECREYVMLKYRQLHLDSNHGFIRLDDDPAPKETKPRPKLAYPINNGFATPSTSRPQDQPLTSASQTNPITRSVQNNSKSNRPKTEIRYYDAPSSSVDNRVASNSVAGYIMDNRVASGIMDDRLASGSVDNRMASNSVDNKMASNSVDNRMASNSVDNRMASNSVDNKMASNSVDNRMASNSVDNRMASNSVDNRMASNSVDNRMASNCVDNRMTERNGRIPAKRTNDQPQINTSVEPREKVHKELPSRGALKKRPAPPPPQPAPDPRRDLPYWSAEKRAQDEERRRQEQTAYNLSVGLPPVLSAAAKLEKLRKMDALHNRETEEDYSNRLQGRVWQPLEPEGHRLGHDLSHLQPMSAQQFMDRFQELQVGRQPAARAASPPRGSGAAADRFSEIKSSLRELRRGLNEVTAPYNSTSNATNNTHIDSNRLSPRSPYAELEDGGELRLPCEFCGVAVPADDLVLHQTGCRPDLTQYTPRESPRSRSPRAPRARARAPAPEEPVIPCEFCTESLPVYLISEHQERCRRESNILYPD